MNNFQKTMKILRIRHEKNLTQMANDLGYSKAYISDIELGNRYVTDKYLNQIQKYFYLNKKDLGLLKDMLKKIIKIRYLAEIRS